MAAQARIAYTNEKPIEWSAVERVLVVRLRSIGDTVLATPSLISLRRFLPNAQIDILVEDWVAPVLDGFDQVDNVVSVGRSAGDRLKTAWHLGRVGYDVAFNLHGGTTATFFTAASHARHRVGYANYRFPYVYNHLLSSSSDFWGREFTHSAEQQLALLGHVGVPVGDRPKTRLAISPTGWKGDSPLALMHPGTAFATKQWPIGSFARTAEHLAELEFQTVAIASKTESATLAELKAATGAPVRTFDNLTLPEITALAAKAAIFVGNDSGIAHIAAAVGTPTVVVFGSSNRNHWHPWTDAPYEIVFEPLACQPCSGYRCEVYGEPKCIQSVSPEAVCSAVDMVLARAAEKLDNEKRNS